MKKEKTPPQLKDFFNVRRYFLIMIGLNILISIFSREETKGIAIILFILCVGVIIKTFIESWKYLKKYRKKVFIIITLIISGINLIGVVLWVISFIL